MDRIKETIVDRYEKAGYEKTDSPADNILRFRNAFSFHFVILFESCKNLEEDWAEAHNRLIEDYWKFEGPRYMEWNYYAVFVVWNVSTTDSSLRQIRLNIQADVAHSRKYVFAADELDELPPGMISAAELKSRHIVFHNALQNWEAKLGKELFNMIVKRPKASIEKRLRSFIEDQIDEQ